MPETLTIGSLFSGIPVGGLELGLERAGVGRVVWQADSDPYCRAVLRRHWPDAVRFEDVRAINPGTAARVELVCGGFPCQPVSLAGERRAQDDERWLWPEFARIVEQLCPAIVVAENVLGLRTAGLHLVLADLARLGFDAEWTVLSARDVGAPHIRKRIFIVATHPERVVVREQQGWLGRSCRARASELAEHGDTRFAADADTSGHARAALESHEGRSRSLLDDRRDETNGAPADANQGRCDRGRELQTRQPEAAGGDTPDGLECWHCGHRRDKHEPFVGAECGECSCAHFLASDPDGERQLQPPWSLAEQRGWARDSGWRHAPPAVRRMDDGLSAGLDAGADDCGGDRSEARGDAPDSWRIGGLGNAVVPQCAEVVGRALMAAIVDPALTAPGDGRV